MLFLRNIRMGNSWHDAKNAIKSSHTFEKLANLVSCRKKNASHVTVKNMCFLND